MRNRKLESTIVIALAFLLMIIILVHNAAASTNPNDWQSKKWLWSNIEKEDLLAVNVSNSPIIQLEILTNDAIKQGGLQINSYSDLLPSLPKAPGTFYAYVEVSGNQIYNSDINGFMKLTYEVPKSFIESNGLDAKNTGMYIYDDNSGSWIDVPTVMNNATNATYVYTSYTKTFGKFTITGAKSDALKINNSTAAGSTGNSKPGDAINSSARSPSVFTADIGRLLLIPLGVIAIILLLFLFITSHYNSEADKLKRELR